MKNLHFHDWFIAKIKTPILAENNFGKLEIFNSLIKALKYSELE